MLDFKQVNLLGTDYQLLMSILSKNMTEGANERTVVAVVKKPEIGKFSIDHFYFVKYLAFAYPWLISFAFG